MLEALAISLIFPWRGPRPTILDFAYFLFWLCGMVFTYNARLINARL